MTIYQLITVDEPSTGVDDHLSAIVPVAPSDAIPSGVVHGPSAARPSPTGRVDDADETLRPGADEADGSVYDTADDMSGTDGSDDRTGPSSALTAARKTGKAIAWTAGTAWTGAGYLGHGVRHGLWQSIRHIRAHDHQEAIGGITSQADLTLVQAVRKDRLAFLAMGVAAGVIGTAVGVENLGWIVPAVEAGAAGIGIAALGRKRVAATRPTTPGPAQQFIPVAVPTITPEAAPAPTFASTPTHAPYDGGPYPLALCTTPDQAADCLRRALTAEKLATQGIDVLTRYPWGWEFAVHLKGATPAKVGDVLDELEGHLELPAGAFMPEPDPKNRSKLTARLAFDDPFADMPKPAGHAPNSLDVRDRASLGRMMDGTDFAIAPNGARSLVIGVSGSAKSTGALRCLVEVITASHNGIAIEMDPVKDGLREFEGVMAAPPIRGGKDCVEWLGYMVDLAEARNKMRHRLGMGDSWVPSAEHPAIFVIVDEYIYLPPEGKEHAIALLRLGRQSGIFPLYAAQDGTSDSMGRAIADSFTLRIMLAARHADVTVVFGQGAIADGYRPDRLTPAQNDQERCDAGRFYVKGGGYNRPLKGAFNEYTYDHIKRLVAERAAAGRPGFDLDSLTEAGLLHLTRIPGVVVGTRGSSGPGGALADRIDRLATEHGVTDGPVIAALLRLFEAKGADFVQSATLIAHLGDEGIAWGGLPVDGDRLGRILRAHAPGVQVSRPTVDGKQVRGWYLEDVTKAAEGLLDPSRARQQAA